MKRIIRAKDGRTRRVSLTPLKAIRAFCLECQGHSRGGVRNCGDPLCPLWPYRLGTDPGRERMADRGLTLPGRKGEEQKPGAEKEEGPPQKGEGQAGLFDD